MDVEGEVLLPAAPTTLEALGGGQEGEGRGGSVGAAELHVPRVVEGDQVGFRRQASDVGAGVMEVAEERVGKCFPGELAAPEEEVEVDDEIVFGEALADHEVGGSYHVAKPLRHRWIH